MNLPKSADRLISTHPGSSPPPKASTPARSAIHTSFGWFLICLAWLTTACRQSPPPDDGLQLLLGTVELRSDTSFELRAPWNIAPAAGDAAVAEESPLEFDPPLAGHFEWKSRRSGVYTPSEPLALGTEYVIRLKRGLKDAQGNLLAPRLLRRLETPGLAVSEFESPYWNTSDLTATPAYTIWFNALVAPEQLQRRAHFINRAIRESIRVVVEPSTNPPVAIPNFLGASSGMPSRMTWREQFGLLRKSQRAAIASQESTPPPAGSNNEFQLRPERPLPAGEEWELVIEKGLKSTESSVSLGETFTTKLGTVRPFELETIEASSTPADGRVLRLTFSKPVQGTPNVTALTNWIQVEPAPTNLGFRSSWKTLQLRGDFQLGTAYTVTVRPALPSDDGHRLPSGIHTNLEFAPMTPNIWFPAFDVTQLKQGQRTFPVHFVNSPKFRVRAKLLDEHTLIHTLRGYERYFNRNNTGGWVDFNGVAGRTIFETNLISEFRVDVPGSNTLFWDDILGPARGGAVFIEASNANAANPAWSPSHWADGPQSIIQVSDLGLLWKLNGDQLQAWTFSHHTGSSLPGVRVRLVSHENEFLSDALSDGNGIARLSMATNAVWILAQKNEDLHAVELHQNRLWPWALGVTEYDWSDGNEGESRSEKSFLFTDRSLYRPGEAIHAKGYVRDWQNGQWELSQAREAQIELQDPRGESVLKTNVPISALGSWTIDLPAPLRPRGLYELTARTGSAESRQSIRISDFRPAPFEITAETQSAYHFTNEIQIPISARFFHGDPVEGARMNWNLSAYPTVFSPEGFDSYSFDGEPEEAPDPDAEPRLIGDSLTANAADVSLNPTNTVIQFPRPTSGLVSKPYGATLTVDVTDPNDHTVSKSTGFVLHPCDFYLGFKWANGEESVLAPGVPLTFDAVAVSSDESPIGSRLEVQATLRRIEWKTARVRSAGGAIEFQNHSETFDVQSLKLALQTASGSSGSIHTSHPFASGSATFEPVKTPGSYRVDFATQDASGRTVRRSVSFDVSGDARIAWNFKNGARLQLTPDRSRYKHGDTAAILVKAPFSGTAWITSEREGVQTSYITNLTGSAPLVYVPISPKDAPNVFVSVALVRGTAASTREHPMPEWRIGYCNLAVTAPENELQISVKTDAPATRPGALVRTTVRVTGLKPGSHSEAQPIPNAEVTLFAVDEGVLTLAGDTVPDPLAFYSKPRPLALSTGVSLRQLLTENPDLLNFQNKGAVGGGGGKEGVLGRMRQDFRLSAFWAPHLITDAQGTVQAEFPMPDSLTRFRICAVVTAGPARFGSAATAIQVDKPLMLQPAGIDFAHVGDRIQARALVFNRSESDADVEVSLQLDAKAAHSPLGISSTLPQRQQTVRVPAKSSSRVSFEVDLSDIGESQWEWRAVSKSGDSTQASDAVQTRLQIREARPVEREVFFVDTRSAETNLVWMLNPRLLEGDASLQLHVGNSPLLQLGESIEQLLHYPYGCVEQTSSSLLPWVLFSKTQGLLPGLQTNTTRIDAAIQEGFARLWAMQTASGGLSYWPGGNEPLYWGTAYAALVLNIAHEQDIPVPQNRRAPLLAYLAKKLATDPLSDPTASCLALYALQRGGESVPGALERLADSVSSLTPEDRWMLALTAAAQQSPRLPEILNPTQLPKGATNQPLPLFGSKEREAALRLLFQAQLSTESEATQRAVDTLLALRHRGHWGTTQGNAWALFALHSATPVSKTGSPVTGGMLVGSVRKPFQFDNGSAIVTADFELPRTAANGTPTGIILQNPSRQRLFIHGTVTSKPSGAFKAAPAESQGIAIERRYERLNAENEPSPSASWRPGDRIRVTLRITSPESREWIAIEDPLPACFEVASRRSRAPEKLSPGVQPWQGDFEEVRGDCVRFFRNQLPEGVHEVQYIARVRATGDIVAPATRIEAMYEPQVHGRSAAVVLKIEP